MVSQAYLNQLSRRRDRRWFLPYGVWTCEDGREVIFDRRYRAIVERRPTEAARFADPTEWVRGIVRHDYLYDDGTPEPELRRRIDVLLRAWNFLEPMLERAETDYQRWRRNPTAIARPRQTALMP